MNEKAGANIRRLPIIHNNLGDKGFTEEFSVLILLCKSDSYPTIEKTLLPDERATELLI
jgi:hypothetical protein